MRIYRYIQNDCPAEKAGQKEKGYYILFPKKL